MKKTIIKGVLEDITSMGDVPKNIVGIYNRLSEEDRDKLNEFDESQSIQNQKSMLISYAISQGWEIYNIYSDDDYRGSDRDRPAFNQLMKDAEAGKFNIVLCKSQARFTRELELVEKIIHGQFVEWGIRFVGYADNADTALPGNKKARQINGLVNEWYLEDLSDNIRTVLTDHRRKGMHIGAFALYGYRKDPEQKGHLIIDEEAAEVVRLVFDLYASGMGRTSIAKYLNERGIPNPTEYKRIHGLRYKGSNQYGSYWKYFAISDMLRNEMYIGNMVQGKYRNPSYKSKHSKPVPKEQWIIVENTHEAIIDRALWDKVQTMLDERAKPMCTGEIGLWARKTKCMYCGYTMSSHKSKDLYYLRCPSRYALGIDSCQGGIIPQRFLEKAVLTELNGIIEQFFDETEAQKNLLIREKNASEKKRLQREISDYQKKAEDLEKAIRNSYVDKAKGIITEQEFLSFRDSFQTEIQLCRSKVELSSKALDNLKQEAAHERSMEEVFNKYRNIEQLDRTIVDMLIDHIEIGRNDHKVHKSDLPPIRIHWKF